MDRFRAMQQLITINQHSTIAEMATALSQRLAQGIISATIANG